MAVAARQRTGHGRRAGRGAEQRRRAGLALAVAGFSPPPGPHERNRALVAGVRDDEGRSEADRGSVRGLISSAGGLGLE